MDPVFHKALRRGDINSLKKLLHEKPNCLYGLTAQNNTSLHIAASFGYSWSVIEIYNHCPSHVFWTNARGDTPIHCAARAGHDFVVSFLVGRAKDVDGFDLKEMRNKCGNTPLHEAVRNCHGVAAMELMNADPGLGAVVNGFGESAVYLAAERGAAEMVRLLLEGFPMPDASGPNGQTALHAAVCRSYETAAFLLEKIPNISRQVDASQSSPLHYAASIGDRRMVRMLLLHDASTANLSDNKGNAPIHIAAIMGYTDIILEIIEHCPDALEHTDEKGRNFLHVAVENKRSHVVSFVLKELALEELLNEPDQGGNTPLHLAIINHDLEIINLFLGDERVDTGARTYKGLTPLDLASLCVNSNIRLRTHKIMEELASAGSQISPQRMDLMANKFHRNKEEEVNRYRAIANNLAIVAVLIATVTFAAAFTLPGGYDNDHGPNQGMAILSKRAAFKAFLVSDAIAMVSSITVTCLLIYTGSLDHDVRLHSIRTAMRFMWVALGGMVVAFAMGTYVVVAAECKWLAVLICIMACSVPFVAWMITWWPALGSLRLGKAFRSNGRRRARKSSGKFKVVDFQMLHSMVVDFETPQGSKCDSLFYMREGISQMAQP